MEKGNDAGMGCAETSYHASLSPNPVDAGVRSTAHLTANVTDAPQPQQEETINGPVWGWTVTDVQFQAPGSSTWTDTFAYCNPMVAVPDYSVPDAGLYVTFYRAGSWIVTLKVTVDYSDPAPNGPTWHGEAAENITATCNLNATVLVRRSGSGNTPGSSATVAAGAITNAAHQADVFVQATPPLAGIYVDAPAIANGAGQEANASIAPACTTTGNTGQAAFTFTSSDTVQPVALSLTGSSAAINQDWDDVTDGSDWSFYPFFDLGVPGSITFTPQFLDGTAPVAITAHVMQFVLASVSGTICDPNTGLTTDYSYESTDPTAAGYTPDLSAYATFDPESAPDSGDGTYTSGLTVTDDTLDTFEFDAYDENAYGNY